MSFLSAADKAALRAPRGSRSPFGSSCVVSPTATNLAMLESVRGYLEEAGAPR